MNKKLAVIILGLYALSVLGAIIIIVQQKVTAKKIDIQQITSKNVLVVVPVSGVISAETTGGGYLPTVQDTDRMVRYLEALAKRPEVKAVVLRINSPGGNVAAVQEIYNQILNLRQHKKIVVASFLDIAASGGYYLACAADRIVANPGSLCGSIGVLMQIGNVEDLLKKIGIKVDTFRSGEYKDIGSPFRSITPMEKQLLNAVINDAYQQFLEAVIKGRPKMSESKVREIADGRIFTGHQAKEIGLVDELGDREKAIEVAKELTGIKENWKIETYAPRPWERIIEIFETKNFLPLELRQFNFTHLAYLWQ